VSAMSIKDLSVQETLRLYGLGPALRRRVKAGLVLLIVRAGVTLWVEAKISIPTSAAPPATRINPYLKITGKKT
jgi:hypothetical protein